MTTKTTFFLLGVCVGAMIPLITRALRPLGAYALAGGMLAYEAACDVIESSTEALSDSASKLRHNLKSRQDREACRNVK